MKRVYWILPFLLTFTVAASGDSKDDRSKLNGTWRIQNAAAGTEIVEWTITPVKDSALKITEKEGDKTVGNFECKTQGTPCETKIDGKKASISMWYNGAKLVEMQTIGSDVVKHRFGVLPQGDVMVVEIIPMSPNGKTESIQFKRVP